MARKPKVPTRKIRPPRKPWREMFRYANGRWVEDDGKPDLAFGGKDYEGWPYAFGWVGSDKDSIPWDHPNELAFDAAMDWVCDRYGAANGRRVRAVASNKEDRP